MALLLVPFGMFLVGSAMFEQSWQVSTASLPAAWFTYRVLSWCVAHWSSGRIERLTQGSLLGITEVIARRAGVALGGVYLIGNRAAREANAFASRGNVLAMMPHPERAQDAGAIARVIAGPWAERRHAAGAGTLSGGGPGLVCQSAAP